MKLKDKWEKQNNSVKLLLSKLRRHDTVVVAIAVVIALLLCGGLIYISTPVVAESTKDALIENLNENSEKTSEKLDELQEYLTGLDKSITDNRADLNSFYETSKEELANSEKTTNNVTEKVNNLGGNLNSLHESVSSTEARIEKLREMIENSNESDREKIKSEFDAISSNLDAIKNEYENARSQTKDLMKEIEKAVNSGDSALSKELSDKYQDLYAKLENLDKIFEQQNTDIDKYNTEITNNFYVLNENIDNKFEAMNDRVGENGQDIKNFINEKVKDLNSKLDQVFQYVSRGKQLLASALLTKGIEINPDATFLEFSRAIENIPTQMVLDNGDAAANIEYEYHYHVDGEGNQDGNDLIPETRKGGCFTEAVYHHHTDDCYKKSYTYIFSTKKDVEERGIVRTEEDGTIIRRYKCNYCQQKFHSNSKRHFETASSWEQVIARGGKLDRVSENTSLICGHEDGELLGYEASCGYIHGQVVAAHLRFDGKNSKYNTTVDPVTSQVTTSAVLLDNNVTQGDLDEALAALMEAGSTEEEEDSDADMASGHSDNMEKGENYQEGDVEVNYKANPDTDIEMPDINEDRSDEAQITNTEENRSEEASDLTEEAEVPVP